MYMIVHPLFFFYFILDYNLKFWQVFIDKKMGQNWNTAIPAGFFLSTYPYALMGTMASPDPTLTWPRHAAPTPEVDQSCVLPRTEPRPWSVEKPSFTMEN